MRLACWGIEECYLYIDSCVENSFLWFMLLRAWSSHSTTTLCVIWLNTIRAAWLDPKACELERTTCRVIVLNLSSSIDHTQMRCESDAVHREVYRSLVMSSSRVCQISVYHHIIVIVAFLHSSYGTVGSFARSEHGENTPKRWIWAQSITLTYMLVRWQSTGRGLVRKALYVSDVLLSSSRCRQHIKTSTASKAWNGSRNFAPLGRGWLYDYSHQFLCFFQVNLVPGAHSLDMPRGGSLRKE